MMLANEEIYRPHNGGTNFFYSFENKASMTGGQISDDIDFPDLEKEKLKVLTC